MAEETTTYKTVAEYVVDDKATGTIAKITTKLGGLSSFSVKAAVGLAGVGLGFGALARKVAHANMEMEGATKSIAGALFGLQNWKAGVPSIERVQASMEGAHKVVEKLEAAEERLAMPLTELAATYRTVAGPAFAKLGLTQEQVIALTEKSAEAAKVFGLSGEQAASTIARAMLTKTVRGMDPFSVKLKLALGDIKKLSAPEIYRRIQKQLGDLAPVAEKFSQGFSGAMFRLQDLIEDTLRDVGLPVFKAVTSELSNWLKKLKTATEEGKPLLQVYSDKLVGAFKVLKDITAWLFDHWKQIVALVAAQRLKDVLLPMASALRGFGEARGLKPGIVGGAAIGAGGFLGSLSNAVPALAALTVAAQAAADGLETFFVEKLEKKNVAEGLGPVFREMGKAAQIDKDLKRLAGKLTVEQVQEGHRLIAEHARAATKALQGFGLASEQGIVTSARFQSIMSNLSDENLPRFAKDLGVAGAEVSKGMLSAAFLELQKKMFVPPEAKVAEEAKKELVKRGPPQNNFYGDIHVTQDFKDVDPDRVFIRFKEDLERLPERRLQSQLSEVFGE